MCNPETETSRVDDEASESVAERDTRSAVQRNHEALNAGCEVVHGQLEGDERGLYRRCARRLPIS